MKDRELIQACIERQSGAWREFIKRYGALVYHVIWKALKSETAKPAACGVDVEDVSSEVFSHIIANDFRLLRTFKWRCKFSTWLGIVTYRTTRQALHRNRHAAFSLDSSNYCADKDLQPKDILPDSELEPPEELELDEARRMVHEALAALPLRDQLVVKFFYFEGKKYAEIAKILGISPSLVGTALFRAKLRLARKLHPDFLPERNA